MNKNSMRDCSSRPHELHIQRWSSHLKVTDSRGLAVLCFLVTAGREVQRRGQLSRYVRFGDVVTKASSLCMVALAVAQMR